MTIEYHFKASVDKVFALLSDPDYLADRCLALGELQADCRVDERGGELVVTMRRRVQRKLPAFLARVFDANQTVELVERWKKNGKERSGSYALKVIGQPVTVTAELNLKPAGRGRGGCTYTVTHAAKAGIPLIGRRIEQFILDQTADGARAELEHLAQHL